MNTFLITYDLGLPESRSDYEKLKNYIKTYSYWAKPLQSVWFVKTEKTVSQIRDELKFRVDSNDKILVIKVTSENWASFGISANVISWMKTNL